MDYKIIKRNFDRGLWNEKQIEKAFEKGFLTEKEYNEILKKEDKDKEKINNNL